MLYIAVAMILLGILCFIYVAIVSGEGNLPKSTFRREYLETLSHARPEKAPPEQEERLIRERDLRFSPPRTSSEQEKSERIFTRPVPIDETPDVVDSVKILGKDGEAVEPAPEEKLIVQGLVYLDTKGKLPLDQKDFLLRDIDADSFQEIRRIGEGALFEEGGKLVFRVKNLSYTFESRDLKQVIFYDEAVVFQPNRLDYPTVIFFTSESDTIKAFFAQAEEKTVQKVT